MQVVVVLSGSMEPAFYRGDILFLYMGNKPFSAGEVVVFNINGRDIPIVHRIIKVHEKLPGAKEGDDVRILTKVRSCSALTGKQDALLVSQMQRTMLSCPAPTTCVLPRSALYSYCCLLAVHHSIQPQRS